MTTVTAVLLYVLIWWTVLFAVLPLGVRPVEEADQRTGWRGAPQEVRLGRKLVLTTLAAALVWAGAATLITGHWLSFRHGILAMPSTYS